MPTLTLQSRTQTRALPNCGATHENPGKQFVSDVHDVPCRPFRPPPLHAAARRTLAATASAVLRLSFIGQSSCKTGAAVVGHNSSKELALQSHTSV